MISKAAASGGRDGETPDMLMRRCCVLLLIIFMGGLCCCSCSHGRCALLRPVCAVAVAGLLWWLLHARTVACGRLCTPRYIKILCLITEYIEPVLEDPTLALFKYIITVCITYC